MRECAIYRNKENSEDEVCQSTNDQGTGIYVAYLNNLRENRLVEQMGELNLRENRALEELKKLGIEIKRVIESNRGGGKGVHGFIGERTQVAISNVRCILDGQKKIYVLIDDNGMTDYLKGDIPIQQKACKSDGALGITHIMAHAKKYPEFIEKGGVYQIPKDFYEIFHKLYNMTYRDAAKLDKAELRLWRKIQKFHNEFPDICVESMVVNYEDIQSGNIGNTIKKEEHKVEQECLKKKETIELNCRATVLECIKVATISAAMEGAVDIGVSVYRHASEKKIRDFSSDDIKEIAIDGEKGALKGAVRGAIVYIITNKTNISAAIATAGVTVAYDITDDVMGYAKKSITDTELAKRIVEHIVDATVSVTFTKLGERYIPIPVIGPLLGNVIGMFMLKNAKNYYKNNQIRKNNLVNNAC